MQNPCTPRSMILAIGGSLQAGEGVEGFLRRVSIKTDLGFRSVQRAWYDQEPSKNTVATLQRFAAHANHVSTRLETIAADLPSDLCREEIDTLRRLAHRLRGLNR